MSKKRKFKGLSWAGRAGLYAGKGVRGIQKYRAGSPGRRKATISRLKETRQIQMERAKIRGMKAQVRRERLRPFVSAYQKARRIAPRRTTRQPSGTSRKITITIREPTQPKVEDDSSVGGLGRFDLGELATFEGVGGGRRKGKKKKRRTDDWL